MRCPLCRAAALSQVRENQRFWACAPCQLAWCRESELQETRFHPHRSPAARRCLSCGGPQLERTLIVPRGLLEVSHCAACGVVSLPLPALLRSPAPPRARPPATGEAGPSPPARVRQVSERDRVFAVLLMLPLELSEEESSVPIGLAALMAACAGAFGLDVLSGGRVAEALALSSDSGYGQLAGGLLTSALVHANLIHLLGNMYFLYAFGRLLERRLGTAAFLALFAASTLLASAAFLAVHQGEEFMLGGASGAVSGILGCYLVLFPTRMVGVSLFFTVLRVPAILYLGLWFFFQLTSVPLLEEGIAYSAHVGGFLVGLLWGVVVRVRGGADES